MSNRLIGVEVRVGWQGLQLYEVKLCPVELHIPGVGGYMRPEVQMTIHTELGDVNTARYQIPDRYGHGGGDVHTEQDAYAIIARQLRGEPWS